MEQIRLDQYYPLLSVKDNICLTNTGDIVLCYALDLPEIFTLSDEDYANIHNFWYRTLKYLPENTFVHKQDIFLKDTYTGDELPNKTFLQRASVKHFKGRTFFNHRALLFIGNSGKSTLQQKGIRNPFKRLPKKEKILKELEKDNAFISEAIKAIDFLNSSRYIKAYPIYEDEIHALIQDYYNGFDTEKYVDTDLEVKLKANSRSYNAIGVGDKRVGIFTINDITQFPDYVDISKIDGDYSSKKYEIFKGASDDFGFKLPFNHIYNQIIYIDDHSKHKQDLEQKKEHLLGAKGFGSDNKNAGKEMQAYLDELSKDQSKKIVRGHSNVIYYADSEEDFERYTSKLSTVYRNLDYKPHYPHKNSIKELYLKSIFPYASGISKGNLFRTELEIALSLFLSITSYSSDDDGVVFSDRIFNIPIKRDIRDESKERIKAWNFGIYGPTGEGKSVLMQHIARQLIEQGKKFIAFDIGGSFKNFSYLFPQERSVFISYEPGKSLPLNPFYIREISDLDSDKKESLAEFVFGLWKPEQAIKSEDRTPLIKLIEAYYTKISSHYSFPNFYEFIKLNEDKILGKLKIEDRFFDIKHFLLSCEQYVSGQYAFLFDNTEDKSYLLADKDIIIFEFEKAQENSMLLNLLMQIGNEAVNSIILDVRRHDGVVFFDEYAKFVKNAKIRARVNYYHNTIRKHMGSVGTSLQTPNQLPTDNETNAMIEQTQVFYILFNEKGYAPIVEKLNLSDHQHNILKSITPNLKGKHPYNEFALIIGKEIWIMRLELSTEELYVYQTDGELYEKVSETIKNNNYDVEKSIRQLIANT